MSKWIRNILGRKKQRTNGNNKQNIEANNGDIELARKYLREQKHEEALIIVKPLIDSYIEDIKYEANHIAGLSYFQLGRYEEAQRRFEFVASKRNDANSWFNVITSSVLARDIEKSEVAFINAFKAQERSDFSQQPSLPFIRYYYAYALQDIGEFNKALEQLNELKKIYISLKITDDTFVYIRGVPFLSQTLKLAKKVFNGLKIDFKTCDWLRELEEAVDEDGKTLIEEIKKND